jgi:AtzE family amidohydrolase
MMRSCEEIAGLVRSGEMTAVAILEETEAAIRKHDPQLNSFTLTTFERARRVAQAVDVLRRSGAQLPPLAGVPYAVKNLFDIEGEVTLCGGKINETNPPAAADAELVTRMTKAGAVLVGALNMDEHAYGFTTENTHYGATRNPYDTSRIAGGSSGGCGAAVAGGLVPLTLGSDTNGSIRVPSSLCGIFGLKPTYGRLPRTGSFPFVQSLDHLGPFTRTSRDLITAYNALQGPDPRDPSCAKRDVEPAGSSAGKLRVNVLGGWFSDWADELAQQAVRHVAQALDASRTVEWKTASAARSAAFVITGSEGGALHRQQLIRHYAQYEPLSRDRLVAGSLIPASWLTQAQRIRRHAYEEACRMFEDCDLLIAAATPLPATAIGTEMIEINGKTVPARPGMGLLTQPISCIGLPVCTVPVWLGGPLPIGVQLIAAPWREDLCLAAAQMLEDAGAVGYRVPPAYYRA